jgi:predicted permease
MEIFLSLLTKTMPLYFIIILGWVASKYLNVVKESIGKLLIYIISPAIVLYGTYIADVTLMNLSLPLLFFCITSFIALIFLQVGTYFYGDDSSKNILAFASGNGNTGYLGLPIILMILGDGVFSSAVLCILGFTLYENTVGFIILAKGNYTFKQALHKVARLPTVYAFAFGLLFNIIGIDLGDFAHSIAVPFKGAYTLLGMMLVGMGLAEMTNFKLDMKFISISFIAKFLFWPILVYSIIFIDQQTFKFYTPELGKVFMILSVVPLAANTVAWATVLKVHPDKAALAVLLSTIFALFYIPLALVLFF